MADCTGIVGCRECDINLGCHDKIMAMIDASQRNQAAREGWGPTAQAKIATLEAKKAALEEKLAEANQWISDMQAGCYINCVYCGHRYGPDDEYAATLVDDGATPTMQDALKAHIEQCPKHPMSEMKAHLAATHDNYRRALDEAAERGSTSYARTGERIRLQRTEKIAPVVDPLNRWEIDYVSIEEHGIEIRLRPIPHRWMRKKDPLGFITVRRFEYEARWRYYPTAELVQGSLSKELNRIRVLSRWQLPQKDIPF